MSRTLKILFILLFCTVALLVYPTLVNASDTLIATSTLNGISVSFEYKLNDAGQVTDLVCTNASVLSGSVTVPGTLEGKTVVSLGNNAFKGASNITSVVIPESIKEIGLWAFSGCTSLSNVNLGNVEKLSNMAFNNCTALTSIKLPKTLTKIASGAPFSGCTNLKHIELENGMTVIPNYVCASTPITEITIPNTVKEIGLWAFSDCTSLSNVNLGNVEKLSDKAFNNCTALTSIKLPKTLTKIASGAPFSGCTNLKHIELENGMTVIPNYVCASTPITEITIPNTVKEIGLWAFSDCTSLSNVNLGNVEKLSDKAFNNCTALTSIKLPKTLTKIASGAPFSGCTNLKHIELENGMTVIPNYVCASTPITEITIPNTVKEIGLWAFSDCTFLKKIKILDNVTDMGGYNSSTSDLVFKNHNTDLTIYCYQNSLAAAYAIKYNIKFEYLPQDSSNPSTDNDSNQNGGNSNSGDTTNKDNSNPKADPEEDSTTAPGKLPYTGSSIGIIVAIFFILGGGIFAYKKYNNLKGI